MSEISGELADPCLALDFCPLADGAGPPPLLSVFVVWAMPPLSTLCGVYCAYFAVMLPIAKGTVLPSYSRDCGLRPVPRKSRWVLAPCAWVSLEVRGLRGCPVVCMDFRYLYPASIGDLSCKQSLLVLLGLTSGCLFAVSESDFPSGLFGVPRVLRGAFDR